MSYPLYKAIFVWQTKFTIKRSYLLVITNVGFYAYSSLAAGRVELKIPPILTFWCFVFCFFFVSNKFSWLLGTDCCTLLISWNWLLYSVCVCGSKGIQKVNVSGKLHFCVYFLTNIGEWRKQVLLSLMPFFCVCICFIKPKLAQASIIWCGSVAKAISIGNLLQVYYS